MKIENSIKKQNSKKRTLGALAIIFAIILIIVITVVFSLNYKTMFNNGTQKNDDSTYDLSPPTQEQKQAGEDIKKQSLEETPTNNELGLSFSSINQSGGQLKIKVAINGAVTNVGTCNLTLGKDGQKIELSKPTFALTSYSTCQGFDIETGSLSKGDWDATLSVTIKDKTSTINKIITLE